MQLCRQRNTYRKKRVRACAYLTVAANPLFHKEKNRVKSKGGREKRKKEGRCIRCSCELNPDVDEGYAKCMNCRQGLPGGYYETIPKIYAL